MRYIDHAREALKKAFGRSWARRAGAAMKLSPNHARDIFTGRRGLTTRHLRDIEAYLANQRQAGVSLVTAAGMRASTNERRRIDTESQGILSVRSLAAEKTRQGR